jgi:hypothetical protein
LVIAPTDHEELQIETGEVQSVAIAQLTHGNGVLEDERLATPPGEATSRHRHGDTERNRWFATHPGLAAKLTGPLARSTRVEHPVVSVSALTQRRAG